jgi:hypothetical protein
VLSVRTNTSNDLFSALEAALHAGTAALQWEIQALFGVGFQGQRGSRTITTVGDICTYIYECMSAPCYDSSLAPIGAFSEVVHALLCLLGCLSWYPQPDPYVKETVNLEIAIAASTRLNFHAAVSHQGSHVDVWHRILRSVKGVANAIALLARHFHCFKCFVVAVSRG